MVTQATIFVISVVICHQARQLIYTTGSDVVSEMLTCPAVCLLKKYFLLLVLSFFLVLPAKISAQSKTSLGNSLRYSWVTYSRTYDAVVWSFPAIQSMQIKKELFDKSGRKNSLGYISGYATRKMVVPTFSNFDVPIFGNLDLKDGPMVVEFPARPRLQ